MAYTKVSITAKYEPADFKEQITENVNAGETKVKVCITTEDRKQKAITFLKCAGVIVTLSVVSILLGLAGQSLAEKRDDYIMMTREKHKETRT